MPIDTLPASSGGWLAFVSGPRLLLVEPPTDENFIASAWREVQQPTGFQSLLDLLTSRGLAATPSFALVDWQSGSAARLVVRGDAILDVTDAAGTQQVTAAGVSTWVERTMPGVTVITLAVPAAVGETSAPLPIEAGVALVARVSVGPAIGAAASSRARSRTTAPNVATPTAPNVATPTTPPAAPNVATPATASTAPNADLPATARAVPTPPSVDVDIDIGATMAGLPDKEHPEPDSAGSYDYLFGETVHRSVSEAAVPEPGEQGSAATSEAPAGDHDGHTILTSDIAKLRGPRKSRVPSIAPQPDAPKLVLVVSTTGAREPLAQPILVGRSPSVSKVSGAQIPRLITITGNDQDISRNHVQVAVEGGTVVVTDLHSKNGTSIVLPGKAPQKLRAGEPASVIVGTVVDLGAGITLTVDEDR